MYSGAVRNWKPSDAREMWTQQATALFLAPVSALTTAGATSKHCLGGNFDVFISALVPLWEKKRKKELEVRIRRKVQQNKRKKKKVMTTKNLPLLRLNKNLKRRFELYMTIWEDISVHIHKIVSCVLTILFGPDRRHPLLQSPVHTLQRIFKHGPAGAGPFAFIYLPLNKLWEKGDSEDGGDGDTNCTKSNIYTVSETEEEENMQSSTGFSMCFAMTMFFAPLPFKGSYSRSEFLRI